MRVASLGHAVFAVTLIVVGLLGLIQGDFAAIWQPLPRWVPAARELSALCALITLGGGAGLLWTRAATVAARTLLGYLLLCVLLTKVRYIVLAPAREVSYESCGETVVILAGAWVLYAWLAAGDRRWLAITTGAQGLRIARVLYALALIAFGLSHLAYARYTATLVPGWLPAHLAFVYLTAVAYLAAALAILTGVQASLAAVLSAAQMGLFTVLVWVPRLLAGPVRASLWQELAVSWAMTAGAWMVADSYRLRGLAAGQRASGGAAAGEALERP